MIWTIAVHNFAHQIVVGACAVKSRMTRETLSAWISEGRGQGCLSSYRPWIRHTRRSPHGKGNVNLPYIPLFDRQATFLSRNEWEVALLVLWLGVNDMWEQYPFWPWPHPHPLYGQLGISPDSAQFSRGTLALARDLGIRHGVYPGSAMPYVSTTDIVFAKSESQAIKLIAVDAKPLGELEGDQMAVRTHERLVLARTYYQELGIPWFGRFQASCRLDG